MSDQIIERIARLNRTIAHLRADLDEIRSGGLALSRIARIEAILEEAEDTLRRAMNYGR